MFIVYLRGNSLSEIAEIAENTIVAGINSVSLPPSLELGH